MNQQTIKTERLRAFNHLIYEYRNLANAAHAWKHIGDSKISDTDPNKKFANEIMPEVGTLIQDSILLHTRNLINFFWPAENHRGTDITVHIFIKSGISNHQSLINLKRPIEVHVLHLTSYRDPGFRADKEDNVQRLDWNVENGKVFEQLLNALEELSNNVQRPWREEFMKLIHAAKERFDQGRQYDWPL